MDETHFFSPDFLQKAAWSSSPKIVWVTEYSPPSET